jgi:DNA polymerase elongation subunit (family B)
VRYVNAIPYRDATVFVYRDDTGRLMKRQVPAEYVSYHLLSQASKLLPNLRRSRVVTDITEEGEWLRLRWCSFDARKDACAPDGPFSEYEVQSFEADLNPVRRYMADHHVEVAKPRIAYLDIETDSRVPFSEKERARILCWTLVDGEDETIYWQGKLQHDTDEDECRILNELWGVLVEYDLLVAWMSPFAGEFDFEVIVARTKAVGAVDKHVRRLLYLDHCKLFKRMNMTSAESGEEKRSYKLNRIANAVIGEGKDEFDSSKTWDAWCRPPCRGQPCKRCRECLFRYNVKDTVLMPRIEAKTGFIALFQTLCEACGVFPESRSLLPTVQMDAFMLRLGKERNVHFKTKYYDEEPQTGLPSGQYKGAFVVELTQHGRGIVKSVHVGDFKSMYPNIMLTYNMSTETKFKVPTNGPIPDGTCRCPTTRVGFRTDTPGILSFAVSEMLRLREHWNEERSRRVPNTPEWKEADRRATAYKVAVNTFYGALGSIYCRYHDREIAESITQTGVWLIKATIAEAEKRGWHVVAGDTDSIYILGPNETEFREFVKWLNAEFYPRIVAETGAVNRSTMAYEKEFERVIFLSKKKYVGRLAHYKGKRASADSEPTIAGLEYKRGDASRLAMRMQKECIDLLMKDCCEDPKRFETIVDKWLDHVLKGDLLAEEVVFAKSLSNNLSSYVQKLKTNGGPAAQQPHIMLARDLADRGLIPAVKYQGRVDVRAGTRIEYVVTDAQANPARVTWIGEWDGKTLDRHYYWEKGTWPATFRLLQAAFPDYDWSRYNRSRPQRGHGRKVLLGQKAFDFGDLPQTGLRPSPIVVEPSHGKPTVYPFRRGTPRH